MLFRIISCLFNFLHLNLDFIRKRTFTLMDLLYNQHFCFQCFDTDVCSVKAKPTLLCKYIQLQVCGKREINNSCPSELVSNMVWSLVVDGKKKYFTLGSCRSSAQKWQMKCLGSLRLSAQKGFWRCNQPSQESQTGTSKRRSQSFCLSVFSPACQSVMPASLSIAHSSPVKELCVWRLFLSAIRNVSSWWVWLLIFTAYRRFMWSSGMFVRRSKADFVQQPLTPCVEATGKR